jgi:YggT family protein
MYVFKYFLDALATVIDNVLYIYMLIIIARALLSWVNPDPYNPIVRFLYNVTEPVLSWVRRRVPIVFGGLDLSPILVIFAIMFLERFIVPILRETAWRLG